MSTRNILSAMTTKIAEVEIGQRARLEDPTATAKELRRNLVRARS